MPLHRKGSIVSDAQMSPDAGGRTAFAERLIRANAPSPVTIQFFAEVGCDFALWDPDNDHLGKLEDLLPMSEDLRGRIKDWACRGYEHDGGIQRMDEREFEAFRAEGQVLSDQLQVELGPDFRVKYSP
jgi:hypothetical protein